MNDKPGHLTFDSENLAVPEIHTHEAQAEEKTEEAQAAGIVFDNLAMPEIHIVHKQSMPEGGVRMSFAKQQEVDKILAFYRKVIDAVNQTDVKLGWNIEIYPNREFVEEAVEKGQMCILAADGEILAAAVVNHTVNKEYDAIGWKVRTPESKIATIHALATLPSCRGKQTADSFLTQIESYCKSQGDLAIHLDVIDTNVPAYKMYLRNGYSERDCVEMYYEVVGTREFWMLEKVL